MKIITVTSDNYLPITLQLVESIRVWHPDQPFTAYALEKGWGDEHTHQLANHGVEVKVIGEPDTHNRSGANPGSGAIHCFWKLDAFLDQQEPFLYLDADILVLQPLDAVFAAIETDGWFTVQEGTKLRKYHQGPITALTGLDDDEIPGDLASFNAGMMGADPARYQPVFELAKEWGDQITEIFLGDQGLQNLAYYKLHRDSPKDRGNRYNGGWTADGQVNLAQAILHFGGPKTRQAGMTKASAMQSVWKDWPKGVKLDHLTDTDFWRSSLPHPWPWLNQCNQRRYRPFVQAMRRQSRSLIGTQWLLVENQWQAYLLDRKVLNDLDRFWAQHGDRYCQLNHLPTYHLDPYGKPVSRWSNCLRRWRNEMISLIPR